MSGTCETVQDLLPDLAAGRLDAARREGVEAHLGECGQCAGLLETLTLLAGATPAVPDGLEARIRSAVLGDARPVAPAARPRLRLSAPAWGLAAAAVMALLLGRTLVDGNGGSPEILAMGQDEPALLLPDDGVVAGSLVLDALTDDELAILLEEMER